MIYVIAGNHREAYEWMSAHKLRPEVGVKYVRDYSTLVGCDRGSKFVMVMNWRSRKDIHEILMLTKSREMVEVSYG